MKKHLYQQICEKIKNQDSVILESVFPGISGTTKEIIRTLKPAVPVNDEKGRLCYKVEQYYDVAELIVREPMIPSERLIVFGGGHVSLMLCRFAAVCGFQIVVADDRPEFASRERFSMASEVICDKYSNAVQRVGITARDYVVVVTRGHISDSECLREILSGIQPFYFGLMGSRKRVKAQFEMLVSEGYSEEQLSRIHTPVGLNIGAVTPAEIAVCIVAELISCKRIPEPDTGRTVFCNQSDLETSVIEKLACDCGNAALVTVLESEGSSPRKAGAKMIVWQDGSIFGTIGGGLGEGKSIQEAVGIIGTGTFRILDYSLTAKIGESGGMACGGRIKVLIEDLN